MTLEKSTLERFIFFFFLLCLIPAIGVRFYFLSNPLVEPHPYRQTMTALVTQHFWQHGIDFFSYRSPSDGLFWNIIHEFPIYQWLAVKVMGLGVSLEAASRLVTLSFFFSGGALLFYILFAVWGTQVACWGIVCYLISPYNIVYSRTSLIDFTAQFFMLAMVACALKALRKPSTGFAVLAVLSGCFAVLVKCYLWFVPAPILFFYCAHRYWKEKNREALWIALGLLLQLGLIVAWLLWTAHLRSQEFGSLVSLTWIFGTLEQRLHFKNWIPQFRWIARWVLHDWMVFPFLLGIVWGKPRRLIYVLVTIILLPIVVLFNSSQHHDYYLISHVPYIFALVGLGWQQIFKLTPNVQRLTLAGMAVLLAHAALNLPVSLAPIFHDYHCEISDALDLKRISTADDRIYLEGYDERFDMLLYSERLARPYYRENVVELNPTLLVFRKNPRPSALRQFQNQWVDSESKYFTAVRVNETPAHRFDPKEHVGLVSNAAHAIEIKDRYQANLCTRKQNAFFKVPKNSVVSVKTSSREIVLSGGEYLNLPSQSEFGCVFDVSVRR